MRALRLPELAAGCGHVAGSALLWPASQLEQSEVLLALPNSH